MSPYPNNTTGPQRLAEAVALVDLLCNEQITPQQFARLEELAAADRAVRQIYIRYLHLHATLPQFARETCAAGPGKIPRRPNLGSRAPIWSTIALLAGLFLLVSLVAIVPAYRGLRRAELENAERARREEQERQLAASKVQEEIAAQRRARENSRALFGTSIELLAEQNPLPVARALRDSAVWAYAHGLGQARLTFALDCRWHGAAPGAGEALTTGRRLILKSGLAEIVFQNGARTILQGPSTLQILSGSSAFLQVGRYTVNVDDPRAKGFVVGTPGMKYTDLGTEFGVVVDANGHQEMHVFRGLVRAEAGSGEQEAKSTEQGDSTADSMPRAPRSLLVTAHEAIRVAAPIEQGQPLAPLAPIEPIAANERQFVRDMPRERFPLFGTGVDQDVGAADPHWEITSISTDPDFKPQNAVVCDCGGYLPDVREVSQWVSISRAPAPAPSSCKWTMRTEFDLTGFDPATARIDGQFAVDDFLAEIRLNGKPVPLPERARLFRGFDKKAPLQIDGGFVAGRNTLEVVIENAFNGSAPDGRGTTPEPSPMLLNLELHGTARKITK